MSRKATSEYIGAGTLAGSFQGPTPLADPSYLVPRQWARRWTRRRTGASGISRQPSGLGIKYATYCRNGLTTAMPQ